MHQEFLYWQGLSESQLAAFQGDQGTSNHCAKYAAASALNLLYGTASEGKRLVDWIQARPLQGTGRYTIWGNNLGSLVFQTANLVRKLAELEGLSPRVQCRIGRRSDLLTLLGQGGSLGLVSLTYFQGKEPLIARGQSISSSLAPARWVGGHIMVLGAYDPTHFNSAGGQTPWGFLSSWGSPDQLYWMAEREFLACWGRFSLFNLVTVSRAQS